MNQLYLTYTESRYGGEICAGQEEESWPSHEDEYIEWSLRACKLSRDPKHWLHETVDIDFSPAVGSTVYVVYVRYSTGGTFIRTNGAWRIMGIFSSLEEAIILEKSVNNGSYDGYKFWEGHFESFESCEVESMTVEA
jgi:hypothetical protein